MHWKVGLQSLHTYIHIYDCPLDSNCQARDIIYKSIALATINPEKVYLGKSKGNSKNRYYNHKTSFNNRNKYGK